MEIFRMQRLESALKNVHIQFIKYQPGGAVVRSNFSKK